jgi:hypothetical protein
VTIRGGKITVENGLLGEPNLKVVADSETWLVFLAAERNLLWALLTRPHPAARKPKVVAGAQTLFSIRNFTWTDL